MIYEITARNEIFQDGEVKTVTVQYSVHNKDRSVHAGGRFETEKDKSIVELKKLAKEHFLSEVNAK
ncbi:hypothetical protein GLW20_01665 [Virgibacillus halodenitrificans]|nr:hypothetical protein [Virgibacillus halodenitrificans]